MVSWKSLTLAVLASAVADAATKCDANNKCPKDKPCCDEYGECGTGMKCLGGCDPRSSYDLKSCMPMPVCKDGKYEFKNKSGIQDIHKYLGDSEKTPWVYTGKVLEYDGSLLITMPKDSVGTVLSTTHYLWYGNIKATMKTSHDKGVITDFILMSNVKDEVDYEFVGNDLTHAQTNYYYQGVPAYDKQVKASMSDSYENYHTYEVDWTEDKIDWKVDGKVVRTLKKDDTYNQTTKQHTFPQTPARLQLGIWPGGGKNQGQGTIDWAGGPIDWDSEDIKKDGYYSATIKSVEVKCYDAPSGTKKNGKKSYRYSSRDGTQSDVEITDDDTVLYSDKNSGDSNKSSSIADASQASESKSKTESIADASEASESKAAKSTKSTKDSSKSAKATGGSSASSTGGSDSGSGFSQGGDDDSSSGGGSSSSNKGSKDSKASASSNQAGVTSATGYVIPSLMTILGFAYALL